MECWKLTVSEYVSLQITYIGITSADKRIEHFGTASQGIFSMIFILHDPTFLFFSSSTRRNYLMMILSFFQYWTSDVYCHEELPYHGKNTIVGISHFIIYIPEDRIFISQNTRNIYIPEHKKCWKINQVSAWSIRTLALYHVRRRVRWCHQQ